MKINDSMYTYPEFVIEKEPIMSKKRKKRNSKVVNSKKDPVKGIKENTASISVEKENINLVTLRADYNKMRVELKEIVNRINSDSKYHFYSQFYTGWEKINFKFREVNVSYYQMTQVAHEISRKRYNYRYSMFTIGNDLRAYLIGEP